MTARVFISYRASDGADKATALARDLDALFGDAQIFLDKDDLPAGSPWRAEVARALQAQPILLVLVTPNYLGATDAEGRRRIDSPDDPARTELTDALAANALVVPLMCDGVNATPPATDLPAPFDQLCERTWRRLRAYDWREDLARLARDLEALGLVRRADIEPNGGTDAARVGSSAGLVSPAGPGDSPALAGPARSRRTALVAFALIGSGAAIAAGVWQWQRGRARSLSGRWRARIGARGATTARTAEAMLFTLEQQGSALRLSSGPIDIEHDPDWENHRDYWKQRTGQDLKRVLYRGEGQVLTEAGEPIGADKRDAGSRAGDPKALHRVSIAIRIEVPGAEGEPIDRGEFRGTVEEQDDRIRGRLWLKSEHAERVVEMRLEP